MEISGHNRFIVGGTQDRRTAPERLTPEELAFIAGERLLISAIRLLERADVAHVAIELRGEGSINEVRTIRLDGPIAFAGSRRGCWDHSVAIDRVIGIRTTMA